MHYFLCLKRQNVCESPPYIASRGIARCRVQHRLRFGKMVDKVIPYLPMDPPSNLLVIELKLQRLGELLPGGLYTTSGETPRLKWGEIWKGASVNGKEHLLQSWRTIAKRWTQRDID